MSVATALPSARGRVVPAALLTAAAGLAFAGGASTSSSAQLAGIAALAPAIVLLLVNPQVAAMLAVVAIPFPWNVAGGAAGGLILATSDLLMLVAVIGAVISSTTLPAWRARWGALKPAARAGSLFVAWSIVILPLHGGIHGSLKTVQRFELIAVPLIVGAVIVPARRRASVVRLFVVAASALAFVWLLSGNSNNALGIDKNPAGQFMTDGIIVLLARRDFPALARWTLLPLLASGLIFTGSRGAFVGLIVGLAMLASLSTGDRRLILLRVVPLALAAVIAYQHLPDDLRARATTLSSSGPSASGVYTLKIRQRYQHDALAIIRARPWTGVGVGNYLAGSVAQNDLTSDPHDVLLLTTAEGGLPLLAGFGLLLVGSSVPLMRRRTSWAPVALAVQAAIVAHGVADVYWVRSTPTLGWLLIGFALAERHVAKFAAPTQHHVVPRYAGATL